MYENKTDSFNCSHFLSMAHKVKIKNNRDKAKGMKAQNTDELKTQSALRLSDAIRVNS